MLQDLLQRKNKDEIWSFAIVLILGFTSHSVPNFENEESIIILGYLKPISLKLI